MLPLYREFSELRELDLLDAHNLYLYFIGHVSRTPSSAALDRLGLFSKEASRHDEARQALVESLNAYPWNWSAWKLLISECNTSAVVGGCCDYVTSFG